MRIFFLLILLLSLFVGLTLLGTELAQFLIFTVGQELGL